VVRVTNRDVTVDVLHADRATEQLDLWALSATAASPGQQLCESGPRAGRRPGIGRMRYDAPGLDGGTAADVLPDEPGPRLLSRASARGKAATCSAPSPGPSSRTRRSRGSTIESYASPASATTTGWTSCAATVGRGRLPWEHRHPAGSCALHAGPCGGLSARREAQRCATFLRDSSRRRRPARLTKGDRSARHRARRRPVGRRGQGKATVCSDVRRLRGQFNGVTMPG
jgi:hypothetical protein